MEQSQSRALVVDDNDDVAEMLATLLRQNGYIAETASSAAEALARCQDCEFHIIVSDLGIPNMNGYELARKLRAMSGRGSSVMIAITGFSIYDDRNRAIEAGFDVLLIKPFGPENLIATIRKLLKNR